MQKISQYYVTDFSDLFGFLANSFPSPLTIGGKTFQNAECAFQAQKTEDEGDIQYFAEMEDADEAKAYGQRVKMRDNWKEYRMEAMFKVLVAKFADPTLRRLLLSTGDAVLVNANATNSFWGTRRTGGHNVLGVLLMQLRAVIREHEVNPPGAFRVCPRNPTNPQ